MQTSSPARDALILYGLFLVLAFGLRSVVHWRRTGSTGFVLPSARASFWEWIGSTLFVISVVTGALAPLLQLQEATAPIAALDGALGHAAGWALGLAGVAGTLWSQFAMGESWRIGVDTEARTALVARGPFKWVRNPIFTNMLLATAGLALLVPNPWALATCLILLLGLEIQVRWVEEPYLGRVHGAAYRAYAASTGRFFPGVGRGLGSVQ